MEIPAIIKVLAALFLIFFLNRRLPIFACLTVGSLVLGVLGGWDLPLTLQVVTMAVIAPISIWLSFAVILILVLSHLLAESRQTERILAEFELFSPGPRFTLVAMPAIIGLLPMPGGAIFSAPLVKQTIGSYPASAELKSAINYWFRHIWEFWWPLYPGIILAITLFGQEPWKMILLQAPLTLGALAGGLIFILPEITIKAEAHPQV